MDMVPSQAIQTIAYISILPKKTFFMSTTKSEIKLRGMKIYEGTAVNDKLYTKGVMDVEKLKIDTQLGPSGLLTVKLVSYNEFGEVVLCANVWI